MRPRLPRHLRHAGHGRERQGHQGPGRPRPPVHPGRPVREGQRLHHPHLQPRPGAPAAPPDGPEGRGPVRAHRLGRGARRDRRPVPLDHRRVRRPGDPALQLPGDGGNPQRPDRRRPVLPPPGGDRQRADVLRLGRDHRLPHDPGAGGGDGPGELRPLPLHHPVGLQRALHQPPHVAVHQGGAGPGGQGGRHRPAPAPHRPERRLVHPHPARHRRRPGPGHDARHHQRGPRRQGLHRPAHSRLRGALGTGAAVPARLGIAGDRHSGRGHRAAGPGVRHDAAVASESPSSATPAAGRRCGP